jgi:hypothetical protein
MTEQKGKIEAQKDGVIGQDRTGQDRTWQKVRIE